MLISDDNYKEKISDFDEINNSLNAIENCTITLSKKQNSNATNNDKIPVKDKLIMFLVGFSYCGLFLISILVSIIAVNFTNNESLLNIIVQSGSYLTLFVVLFVICLKSKKYYINEFKDVTKWMEGASYAVIIIAAEIAVSLVMNTIFPDAAVNGNQNAVEDLITNYPVLMFICTVIIGPMCEELTYRVGLYGLIKEKNETLAFIISGFVFAFVHVSFTDTTVIAELVAFPTYLVIGYLFTYAYKKHGLPCSYVAHALLNLLSFVAVLFL